MASIRTKAPFLAAGLVIPACGGKVVVVALEVQTSENARRQVPGEVQTSKTAR